MSRNVRDVNAAPAMKSHTRGKKKKKKTEKTLPVQCSAKSATPRSRLVSQLGRGAVFDTARVAHDIRTLSSKMQHLRHAFGMFHVRQTADLVLPSYVHISCTSFTLWLVKTTHRMHSKLRK